MESIDHFNKFSYYNTEKEITEYYNNKKRKRQYNDINENLKKVKISKDENLKIENSKKL